ncbi:tRNA pseudouridine(55) synthase TruB [Salmonella enterica]
MSSTYRIGTQFLGVALVDEHNVIRPQRLIT